jgi:hypothetical protein
MLSLRASQAKVLQQAQVRRFERDTVSHVQEQLPQHYAALGEAGTLEAVRQAMAAAASQDFGTQLGVTVFVRLAFIFGLDFAETQEWARAALADRAAAEGVRVQRLSRAATDHARALASAPAAVQ